MTRYRHALPQLGSRRLLTDGGLETTLIFHRGRSLPLFAAFDLLRDADGRAELRRYYAEYAALARERAIGFVLEAPTWRASADWGTALAHSRADLDGLNRRAIDLLVEIRAAYTTPHCPMPIGGVLGPRADGYRVQQRMSADAAAEYHADQIETFADTEADFIVAYTLNYVDEAIGVARAARAARMPVALSFTLETDGRLPSGETLQDAITRTDTQSGGYPAYYMINCAHPEHFRAVVSGAGEWLQRIRGLRANASRRSHAELDAAPDLDAGDAQALANDHRALLHSMPQLRVIGGCCGTDLRHVRALCDALCAPTLQSESA